MMRFSTRLHMGRSVRHFSRAESYGKLVTPSQQVVTPVDTSEAQPYHSFVEPIIPLSKAAGHEIKRKYTNSFIGHITRRFEDCTLDFIQSCVRLEDIPSHLQMGLKSDCAEIAFCGVSNAGKSSLLNKIFDKDRQNGARVGKTPGCTKQLNLYKMTPKGSRKQRLAVMDLPGYGGAIAHKEVIDKWNVLMGSYVRKRDELCCVFVLIDTLSGLDEIDMQFIAFLDSASIKYHIILTKVDSVSKAYYEKTLAEIQHFLADGFHQECMPFIHCTSVMGEDGFGIDELRASIGHVAYWTG
eukprot:665102_1